MKAQWKELFQFAGMSVAAYVFFIPLILVGLVLGLIAWGIRHGYRHSMDELEKQFGK
jgi:Mn2+/Fe2+ NRAMP family transporter